MSTCFGQQVVFSKLHWKFNFTGNFFCCQCCLSLPSAQNLHTTIHFPLLNKVSIARVVALFLKQTFCCQQQLQQTRKHPVLVLASPTSPSCAGVLSQKLGHWFCGPNLWLSSETAFRSDSQIIGRVLNFNSNLNSAIWPMDCEGWSAPKSQTNLCGVWNSL